jgi:hypothetical protein
MEFEVDQWNDGFRVIYRFICAKWNKMRGVKRALNNSFMKVHAWSHFQYSWSVCGSSRYMPDLYIHKVGVTRSLNFSAHLLGTRCFIVTLDHNNSTSFKQRFKTKVKKSLGRELIDLKKMCPWPARWSVGAHSQSFLRSAVGRRLLADSDHRRIAGDARLRARARGRCILVFSGLFPFYFVVLPAKLTWLTGPVISDLCLCNFDSFAQLGGSDPSQMWQRGRKVLRVFDKQII